MVLGLIVDFASFLLRRQADFYYGCAMGGAIAGSGALIWGFKLVSILFFQISNREYIRDMSMNTELQWKEKATFRTKMINSHLLYLVQWRQVRKKYPFMLLTHPRKRGMARSEEARKGHVWSMEGEIVQFKGELPLHSKSGRRIGI